MPPKTSGGWWWIDTVTTPPSLIHSSRGIRTSFPSSVQSFFVLRFPTTTGWEDWDRPHPRDLTACRSDSLWPRYPDKGPHGRWGATWACGIQQPLIVDLESLICMCKIKMFQMEPEDDSDGLFSTMMMSGAADAEEGLFTVPPVLWWEGKVNNGCALFCAEQYDPHWGGRQENAFIRSRPVIILLPTWVPSPLLSDDDDKDDDVLDQHTMLHQKKTVKSYFVYLYYIGTNFIECVGRCWLFWFMELCILFSSHFSSSLLS